MKFTESFTSSKRNDGTRYYHLKDMGNGEYSRLKALIRDIHKDLFFDCFPNDWIYEQIYGAFERLQDEHMKYGFDDAVCEIEGDVYTSDLLEWAKSGYAQDYISDAHKEYGPQPDMDSMIRSGQMMAISAIYYAVWDFIEEERDELESQKVEA